MSSELSLVYPENMSPNRRSANEPLRAVKLEMTPKRGCGNVELHCRGKSLRIPSHDGHQLDVDVYQNWRSLVGYLENPFYFMGVVSYSNKTPFSISLAKPFSWHWIPKRLAFLSSRRTHSNLGCANGQKDRLSMPFVCSVGGASSPRHGHVEPGMRRCWAANARPGTKSNLRIVGSWGCESYRESTHSILGIWQL